MVYPVEINVKSLGAIGDGVVNDTTAIQNAINALPSTGGTVYFPKPTSKYLCNSGLTYTLAASKHIKFTCDPGTEIKFAAGVTSGIKATNVAYIGGNNWPTVSFYGPFYFEHDCTSASDVTLDMRFTNVVNFWDGVICRNVNATRRGYGIRTGPKVNTGSSTWNTPQVIDYGIGMHIQSDHIKISNPEVASCELEGFHVDDTGDLIVENSIVLGGGATTCVPYFFNNAGDAVIFLNPQTEGTFDYHFRAQNPNKAISIINYRFITTAPSITTVDTSTINEVVGQEGVLQFWSNGFTQTIPMLLQVTGTVMGTPGTSYVEVNGGYGIPFFKAAKGARGRITVKDGHGDNAGSNKGVAITDSSGNVKVEVLWSGTTTADRAGSWTNLFTADGNVSDWQLRHKGATAGEALDYGTVHFQVG